MFDTDDVSPDDFRSNQSSQSSRSSPDLETGIESGAESPLKEEIASAIATVEDAIGRCQDDPGVLVTDRFIQAYGFLRRQDSSAFIRLRVKLKGDKPSGVPLAHIERLEREMFGGEKVDDPQTSDRLIDLALELGDLSHDKNRRAYFTTKDQPRRTFRLDSPEFKDYLSYAFYTRTKEDRGGDLPGLAASDAAFRSALSTLSGIAMHDGPEEEIWLRVAPWQNGVLIDLGDHARRVAEVLPTGWRILDESPVRFLQTSSMAALPTPISGGNLLELWQFVNVEEQDRPLVLAWMLESLRPTTPFPVLALNGTQGTAKSSTQQKIRRLTDPNAANLRAAPKSVEDVFVSAGVNWLASFENISHLSSPMQDAFCTLATGGGYAARTLYTNAAETIIEAQRPVIVNSIPIVVTAQDLTDRTIHLTLPEIDRYREESEMEKAFTAAAPALFGALLDLFVETLAHLPSVGGFDRRIRMVDFAKLGEAMMQAQGHDPGAFSRLYGENRRDSVARALEASPVALAVRDLVDAYTGTGAAFHGTIKNLLRELADHHKPPDAEAWPKSPRGLGDALRRQMPALTSIGIEIKIEKPARDGVPVTIRRREHREQCDGRLASNKPWEKNLVGGSVSQPLTRPGQDRWPGLGAAQMESRYDA